MWKLGLFKKLYKHLIILMTNCFSTNLNNENEQVEQGNFSDHNNEFKRLKMLFAGHGM